MTEYSYETGQTNDQGRVICGSKRASFPRNKKPCQATAVMKNGRCRVHGGATPVGIASASYTTGRYSKYMPKRLQDRYAAALEDDHLLSLVDEIALLDTRIAELVGNLDSNESATAWDLVVDAVARLQLGMRSGSRDIMEGALNTLNRVTQSQGENVRAWREIQDLFQQRARLVESERRAEVERELVIKVPQAEAFAHTLAMAVRTHALELIPVEFRDPFLAAVAQDLARFVNVPDGG